MKKNIIHHIERYLGQMERGWSTPAQSKHSFSVAQFKDQPVVGLHTYATIGLSHHQLKLSEHKKVRQELLISISSQVNETHIAEILLKLGDLILSKHSGILRGEVLGPGKPLFDNSDLNALYATCPVYFPDAFSTYKESSRETVFVWLIPIYQCEANYITDYGWDKFEDLLEQKDPDLWDINRQHIL